VQKSGGKNGKKSSRKDGIKGLNLKNIEELLTGFKNRSILKEKKPTKGRDSQKKEPRN